MLPLLVGPCRSTATNVCRTLFAAEWFCCRGGCTSGSSGTDLKAVMREKIKMHREKIAKFRKESGKVKIGDVTLDSVYGGMRGILGLLGETSALDPNSGIRFRNYTIPEVRCKLPKAPGGEEPLPEALFWLLCTGDIPTDEQAKFVTEEWTSRAELPQYIIDMLLSYPKQVHPMAQLSATITACSACSQFSKSVGKVKKDVIWECMYEDCMDLMGKITGMASIIYTRTYKECGVKPIIEPGMDWTHNFCVSMGYDDSNFIELIRLYLVIHSDHGSGNVSAHTVQLVGSALSDCYLSLAAGLNGLAGPLHGLANQTVWVFITDLRKKLGDSPTDDQVKGYCEEMLKAAPIPGYGHAVLRITDPRYDVQREFAEKHLPNDPGVKIVWQLLKVVPPMLKALGKVKNPWPNVDAHSGALLQHYKMTEMNFYTVLFAVSRAMGTLSWLIWCRALGLPIERPKSMTTEELMAIVAKVGGKGGKSKTDTCKKQDKPKC